jgi:guanine deaminase
MESELGNFRVGKSFDAILVDLEAVGSGIDTFPGETMVELFQKFIMLGDDRNISQVFIEGQLVSGPGT